jgi:hypothetical protein
MAENRVLVDMMVHQRVANTDKVRKAILHDFKAALKKLPHDHPHFEISYKIVDLGKTDV